MTSTLQTLVSNLQLRYPDELPPTTVSLERLRYLQGNKEVVDYVLQYLTDLSEEIDRDDILRDC